VALLKVAKIAVGEFLLSAGDLKVLILSRKITSDTCDPILTFGVAAGSSKDASKSRGGSYLKNNRLHGMSSEMAAIDILCSLEIGDGLRKRSSLLRAQ
jgi:hypothetical protein